MSFLRSFFILSISLLLAASGLFYLGWILVRQENISGYAVLTADSHIDENAVLDMLSPGISNFAGTPVSESGQFVLLDEFDSLNWIPLDKYSSRVLSFDPRNDGYADKLKKIFVDDDNRYFYLPLKKGSIKPIIDKQIKKLLGNISYKVEFYNLRKPFYIFFISFAVSFAIFLIICYVKKNTHYAIESLMTLPILISLVWFGAAGITCCALIAGITALLREPLYELDALLRFQVNKRAEKYTLIKKYVIEPFKIKFLYLILFAAATGILIYLTQLKLFFAMLVLTSALITFFFSVKVFSLNSGKHRRFNPVLIVHRKSTDFSFSLYMIPFTAAAFFVMFLSLYVSQTYTTGKKFDYIINEFDYYKHINYQASFSIRQFDSELAEYPSYNIDDDGLPSGKKNESILPQTLVDDFPAFPLESLMNFMASVNNPNSVKNTYLRFEKKENIPLLILLLFVIANIITNVHKKYPAQMLIKKTAKNNIVRKIAMTKRPEKNRHLRKEA